MWAWLGVAYLQLLETSEGQHGQQDTASGSTGVNMEDKLHFKQWRKVSTAGTSQLARQGHAIAVVNNVAYLFGGTATDDANSTIFFNDLYSLQLGNIEESEWELVAHSGDTPSGREGHSLNVVGNNVFMLGGVDSDTATTCAKGLYILNTDALKWIKKEMSGDVPQAQSSAYVVTTDGTRIITFAGILNGHACNDTFVMDTETLVWKCIETSGTKPSARCDYGCAVIDNKMYIFGGSGGESLWFNDLSYIDLDTYQWTLFESIPLPPHPRDYPSLLALNTQVEKLLIVFGGFSCLDDKDVCLNDTHFLSLQSSSSHASWNQFVSSDGIEPVGRYGHASFLHDNKLYVQGGQNSEIVFSDLWMLEIHVPEVNYSPTVSPERDYDTALPIPAPRKKLPPLTPDEIDERSFEDLRSEYIKQINALFDTLTEKFRELDEMSANLSAERKQFEEEREELHSTYDRQQEELKELRDRHQKDNEKWIESLRQENDKERKAIAEEKAKLLQEKNEFESEREKFNEKSNKLDAIMKQVQGLK